LNDVSLEFGDDDKPLTETKTDFIHVYQIPTTNNLQIDLFLPAYSLEKYGAAEKTKYSIILEYE